MDRSFLIVASGTRQEPPAAGITVTNNLLVMVSVRNDPLRITGICRHDLSSTDMSQTAHDKRLGKALRRGRRALRLPRGVDATVALQPQERHIVLRLDQRVGDTVTVRCRPSLPRLLEQAGFQSGSFDVLPASLARAARCGSSDNISLRHRSGWTVRVTADLLEATWSCDQSNDTAEPMRLRGIQVPAELRSILHVGHDAGAVGAALGACGIAPQIGRETSSDVIDLRQRAGLDDSGYRLTARVSTR